MSNLAGIIVSKVSMLMIDPRSDAYERFRVDAAALYLEIATVIVMKKRALEYREERDYPEYVDLGGEGA